MRQILKRSVAHHHPSLQRHFHPPCQEDRIPSLMEQHHRDFAPMPEAQPQVPEGVLIWPWWVVDLKISGDPAIVFPKLFFNNKSKKASVFSSQTNCSLVLAGFPYVIVPMNCPQVPSCLGTLSYRRFLGFVV